MNIPLVTKNKTMHQVAQEANANAVKENRTEGMEKNAPKNRVDSSEISGSHAVNVFEDKRLSSFKAALLYELSSEHMSKQAEEIKERVQNGSYDVQDEVLAEALLGD